MVTWLINQPALRTYELLQWLWIPKSSNTILLEEIQHLFKITIDSRGESPGQGKAVLATGTTAR